MSKSLGNVILPNDVIKQMGAEIIRLWVASSDTTSDVAVSQDILRQSAESYRKIRNTFRFMLANTSDFDPKANAIAYPDMAGVDQYMEVKLNKLLEEVYAAYDEYDFLTVYKKILSFISNDLSAFYLDLAKDILYIDPENSETRRSMQTVIYDIVVKLAKVLTPILPHTMEEIWGFLKEPEDFIQLSNMPEVEHFANEAEILARWNEFMKFRSDVLKALEVARNNKVIGKSFEAAVTVYPTQATAELLKELNANIRQILIVSDLDIKSPDDKAPADAQDLPSGKIVVKHAEGEVCPRCRRTTTDIGLDPRFPNLCARCAKIVSENYPDAIEEGLDD